MLTTELIEKSLKETYDLLSEIPPKETYDSLLYLIKITNQNNKTDIYNMSNFEIFKIIVDFSNFENVDCNTIIKFLNEVVESVNNWTYKDIPTLKGVCIEELDQSILIDAIYKLGLNSNFTMLELRPAFRLMCEVLVFKHKVICLSNGSTPNHRIIKQVFNQTDLAAFVNVFDKYQRENNYPLREEQLKRRLKVTKELKQALKDNTLKDMLDINPEWHQYLDPSLLEEVYNILFENQNKKYREVHSINQRLNDTINRTPLVNYLYKNHINPKDIPNLEELNKIDFSYLLKRIEFFQTLKYPIYQILTELQDYFNIEEDNISLISYLINKNIIKKETIINNLHILKDANILKTNYEILKPFIDFNNMYFKDTILLSPPKTLRNKISVLKEYTLSNNNLIFLLCNYKYLGIYDLIIENNIPSYLLIPICKTYNPLLTIKKIILSREINEPYETDTHSLRKEIRDKDSFYCLDEDIDSYLDRVYIKSNVQTNSIDNIVNNDYIKELDNTLRRGDVYIINNTKVSRPKVLRYLQSTNNIKDNIYISMISDSLLSDEDILNIKNYFTFDKTNKI